MKIDGTYEIVEMELWDKEDIDLVEPGFIRITGNRVISFGYIISSRDSTL
jgi:hypothetical protein